MAIREPTPSRPARRSFGARLAGAWRWWRDGTVAFWRDHVAAWLGLSLPELTIALRGETILLNDAPAPPDAAAWRDAARPDAHHVSVRLDDGECLVQTIALPRVALPNLDEVVALRLDQVTPFKADEVVAGWRRLPDADDSEDVRLRLCVARRAVLAAARQALDAAGIAPDRWLGAEGIALSHGLPAPARHGIGARNALLLLACGALLLAALYGPAWRWQAEQARLQTEIERLRPLAASEQQRRRAAGGALAGAETVWAAKAARPPLVVIVEDLSARLPDDTWLGQFGIVGDVLNLEGSSAAAAALVPLLERSPLFGTVQFQAPVMSNRLTRREHFQFAVGLAGAGPRRP